MKSSKFSSLAILSDRNYKESSPSLKKKENSKKLGKAEPITFSAK